EEGQAAGGAGERGATPGDREGADPADELARRYAAPAWIVRRWLGRYGRERTEALLSAFDRPPGITLRVNRVRATVRDVVASLAQDGVAARPGRLFPDDCVRVERPGRLDRLTAFRRGWVSVQDESSLLAVKLLLPPAPGGPPARLVVDVAAAPGGKALALAEAIFGEGRVLANDRDPRRAEAIRRDARRLGLANVDVRVGDARRLPAALSGAADRVLADVPCSGLGVLHRRPDLRWRRRPEEIPRLSRLAFAIARSAARLLRPGGVMVYSTCTTEPEENEGVVTRLLAALPELALDDLRPHLPPALADEPSARHGWIQCLPDRHGVDGFFAARLVRRAGRPAARAGP
ncbi:MAG: methyltransferase domain-containing protein, partial [Clostridia bacterium]|nr:methyltransferase domain-containing protein [Clostridia bacterium]